MSDDDYRRYRLCNGWLDLHRDSSSSEEAWRLSWSPDEGHPDWPGSTFSPGDTLPSDYPDPRDPDALIAWGRARFGS